MSTTSQRGTLMPVDSVDVHVLVDNTTDSHSSSAGHAEAEFVFLERHGMAELSGDSICCAAHGLSYLITARRGSLEHTILFDAGPEEYALERNTSRLGVDLGGVESIVLSHGHWDHAGGLLKALDLIRSRDGERCVPCYVHPGMFRSRARRLSNGNMLASKDVPSVEALAGRGAAVISTREPQLFLNNMFFLSGEIPRVTPFERGFPGHYQKAIDGDRWEPDPLIMDERSLLIDVKGKGLIVFTACSHAGVINVLTHASECFPGRNLHAVMGGFHLAGANERIIPETVEALQRFGIPTIAPGHCTGWRAIVALSNAFKDSVIDPAPVGKRYTF